MNAQYSPGNRRTFTSKKRKMRATRNHMSPTNLQAQQKLVTVQHRPQAANNPRVSTQRVLGTTKSMPQTLFPDNLRGVRSKFCGISGKVEHSHKKTPQNRGRKTGQKGSKIAKPAKKGANNGTFFIPQKKIA